MAATMANQSIDRGFQSHWQCYQELQGILQGRNAVTGMGYNVQAMIKSHLAKQLKMHPSNAILAT